MRLLPPVRVQGYVTSRFEIVYTPQEIAFMERKPLKMTATKKQLEDMDEVFEWLNVLAPAERKLVWKRAERIPWKLLCYEFGYERAEMWRRYQKALTKISFYLVGKNVGDKKG